MKLFSWMQNKLNGNKQVINRKPNAASFTYHVKQDSREEFSDWPHGLLAIGTFGNNELRSENLEIQEVQEVQHVKEEEEQEDTSSSEDLQDFTPEEIGKLQKELTKLLSRKPTSDKEKEVAKTLPLDRFLNCPSSLEVDRRIRNTVTSDMDDNEEDIERTISTLFLRYKFACKFKMTRIYIIRFMSGFKKIKKYIYIYIYIYRYVENPKPCINNNSYNVILVFDGGFPHFFMLASE
ncbi:hypothetical protein GH714_018454 [Hevea brasiliensis]|uniref:Uncharacterized protein n=1 Tax=Hevea brasiliensis TaxID=3981 RepID=A0A6A6LHJ8_HEVBR|nr:hypothetical protein GH714_018454 [Hevea brasiliensis]